MQARSALFDLYGDHLRARGDRAPVAALVRLMAPLGIAAPAVRTAVSRMVRQGRLGPAGGRPAGPAIRPRAPARRTGLPRLRAALGQHVDQRLALGGGGGPA